MCGLLADTRCNPLILTLWKKLKTFGLEFSGVPQTLCQCILIQNIVNFIEKRKFEATLKFMGRYPEKKATNPPRCGEGVTKNVVQPSALSLFLLEMISLFSLKNVSFEKKGIWQTRPIFEWIYQKRRGCVENLFNS